MAKIIGAFVLSWHRLLHALFKELCRQFDQMHFNSLLETIFGDEALHTKNAFKYLKKRYKN